MFTDKIVYYSFVNEQITLRMMPVSMLVDWRDYWDFVM